MKKILFVLLAIIFISSCEKKKEPVVFSEDANSKLRSAYNEGYDKAKMEDAKKIRNLQNEIDYLQQLISKEESELTQILSNEKLFFFQDSVRSRLKFEEDDLRKLLFEVHYNDQTILSTNFEAVYIQPDKNNYFEFYDNLFKAKKYLNKGRNKNRINFFAPNQIVNVYDNIYMVTMSGYGYESIPYIFAYFKKENGLFSFMNFFDKIYGISYGIITIEGIYKIDNDEHLMILNSKGGDGGDEYEELKFVSFNENYGMHEIYKKFSNYYMNENRKELTYQVYEQENRIIIVNSEFELMEDGSYKNISTEFDTLKVSFK